MTSLSRYKPLWQFSPRRVARQLRCRVLHQNLFVYSLAMFFDVSSLCRSWIDLNNTKVTSSASYYSASQPLDGTISPFGMSMTSNPDPLMRADSFHHAPAFNQQTSFPNNFYGNQNAHFNQSAPNVASMFSQSDRTSFFNQSSSVNGNTPPAFNQSLPSNSFSNCTSSNQLSNTSSSFSIGQPHSYGSMNMFSSSSQMPSMTMTHSASFMTPDQLFSNSYTKDTGERTMNEATSLRHSFSTPRFSNPVSDDGAPMDLSNRYPSYPSSPLSNQIFSSQESQQTNEEENGLNLTFPQYSYAGGGW